MDDLRLEKYVSVKTLKRSGEAVATPVGSTVNNGRPYFATPSDSYKVRRIRNHPNVEIPVSDRRGTVNGQWNCAPARIVDDATFEPARGALARKHPEPDMFFAVDERTWSVTTHGGRIDGTVDAGATWATVYQPPADS